MIGKVTRGRGVFGLLRYLYGPGRRNEHTDPHLVAGWDDPAALEPARRDGRAETAPLARLLDQPLHAATGAVDPRPVWQCSVRTAPEDRQLTDTDWAAVARDVVGRAGFAGETNDGGCRWVAVRHDEDHIHIVVTLARQDGRAVRPRNDYYRVGEACRVAEERLGLHRAPRVDRTAARKPTYGEREKAQRSGLPEPASVTLRRQVRTAATGANSVEGFLARLRADGLLVRERLSDQTIGEITGYAVALPDVRARTASGGPVWYGGSKLAADLSLPKLRGRWRPASRASRPDGARFDAVERAAVWAHAQCATASAAAEIHRLAGSDPAAAADAAWAAADTLTVAARIGDGPRGGPLTRAADAYERAARELWGRAPAPTPTGNALRGVARALALTGRARRDETTQMMALVVNLIALTQAVALLRDAQDRAAQAAAARAAADQLRTVAKHGSVATRAPTHLVRPLRPTSRREPQRTR